ncbi:hypothetical protein TRIP_B200454 [uncultured Desulfatiglans sp.]|uniref:Uncharacterized protein n=1 Tax=Uncultured Desulfatiglans sp. TaxID=1748965 RepID=A0A653A2S5_UNCDX|nr:hypothetical protein TRIP_B200454 [uncultured Desulfatiglans sp.]
MTGGENPRSYKGCGRWCRERSEGRLSGSQRRAFDFAPGSDRRVRAISPLSAKDPDVESPFRRLQFPAGFSP